MLQASEVRAGIAVMRKWLRKYCLLLPSVGFLASSAYADDWAFYGRDAAGTRFSPLTQISTGNVAGLKPVWTFHTGDISDGTGGMRRTGFESTPLVLDGKLYLTTGFNRVIALDAASGQQIWAHDPVIDKKQPYGDGLINRGVAAWRDPAKPTACAIRLFEATLDARLIALDAVTGAPCADFGAKGEVDLKDVPDYHAGWYHMTSPPVVIDGVVVVGSAIDDNARAVMPGGVVRGFDAVSGRKLWSWSPLAGQAGKTGAGNAWSVMSADPVRHLVYVPTGSASPDYYGGLRPGENRWANSVVALDSRSGKLEWGFQLVHHDLWDYDTAAPPLLTRLRLHGRTVPVVIAGNKTGMLYVLNPGTGKPVLPVEERTVPQSDVPGEVTSPTQPFSSLPQLARWSLAPPDAWGVDAAGRDACRRVLEGVSSASLFSPPSTKGIISMPGSLGGINWSGFAWDAQHQRLIVAVTNLAYRIQLIPSGQFVAGARGDFRGDSVPQAGTDFAMTRAAMVDAGGPCIPPPWGELVALDLPSGKIAWRQSVGTMDELIPGIGKLGTGSPILGGPIVTAGGLIFIGGSMDRRFHAFSSESGKEVWSAELPASGHAQPITYQVGGRQYIVIAAGGSAQVAEEKRGDALVAFALN